MLAAERKKKGTLAKSPQVPHSETIATGAATDARETCMAQLVLVAQQSRVIGELEMKLAKMEEDKLINAVAQLLGERWLPAAECGARESRARAKPKI